MLRAALTIVVATLCVLSTGAIDPISTCPDSDQTGYNTTCEEMTEQIVCDPKSSKSYKNPACARCNMVNDFNPGVCSASTSHLEVKSSCDSFDQFTQCEYPSFSEVVCYRDVNYYNPTCAECAGASFSDLRFGVCELESTALSTCKSSASEDAKAKCNSMELEGSYVCMNDVTYRSAACAECNKDSDSDTYVLGPCAKDSPVFHPCTNNLCGENAQCTLSLAHCHFEAGHTCGWVSQKKDLITGKYVDAGFNLVKQSDRPPLAPRAGSGESYMLATEDNSLVAEMFSSPAVTIKVEEACKFVFHAAGRFEGTRIYVELDDNVTVMSVGEPILISAEDSGVWKQYTYDLSAYSGNFQLRFKGYLKHEIDSSDINYIGIDDIALECAEDDEDVSTGVLSSCECKPGYGYDEDGVTCVATMYNAIKADPRLTTLADMLHQNHMDLRLSNLQMKKAFFAPTNDALAKRFENGADSDLYSQLFQASSPVAFEFLETHLLASDYRFGDMELGVSLLTNGSRSIKVVQTNPSVMVGEEAQKATIVDSVQTANGVVFLIDGFLEASLTSAPTDEDFCSHCSDDGFCSSIRKKTNCGVKGGCYEEVDSNLCEACAQIDTKGDVCGEITIDDEKVKKTFRSKCLAQCRFAENIEEGGPCRRPVCLCNTGFTGDGIKCTKSGSTTPTVPPTTRDPETIPSVGHKMGEMFFWIDGYYDFVIGGRQAMRDSHFQQEVREALIEPAGISVDESMSLGIELFPSARVPGYILVRMSGIGMTSVFDRSLTAIRAGNVSFYWKHEDADSNPDALQKTLFTCKPLEDLPPITRYTFWVDGDYRRDICQPNEFGACQGEFVNKERLVDQIRFSLGDEFGLVEGAVSKNTYIWVKECQRTGLEGKIEIDVTAFSFKSETLMQIRAAVESGTMAVVYIRRSDGASLTQACKAIPFGSRPVNVPTLRAVMGPYPGYHGDKNVAGEIIVQNAGQDHISVKYDLLGLGSQETGGIHIHEGTTCDIADEVLGHYYVKKTENVPKGLESDPWDDSDKLRYTSFVDGQAFGEFNIYNGAQLSQDIRFTFPGNSGRAVVVHDQDGVRVGCGVLEFYVDVEDELDSNLPYHEVIGTTEASGSSNTSKKTHDYMVETIAVIVLALMVVLVILYVTMKPLPKSESPSSMKTVGGPSFENPLGQTPGSGNSRV